jgi:pimeloyl-ACP methyl ester carboxylesterase
LDAEHRKLNGGRTADPLLLRGSPAWFARATAIPYGHGWVQVAGCNVHYLHWGEMGRRGLVFVHGGGAHAHWWTHVAATFAAEFSVVAIDLSGHGDSGHREAYDPEQWADEVAAVAADAGIDGVPVVIGHSMGGFITIVTAARHSDEVAGVIICDSPVTEADPEISAPDAFGRTTRTYPAVDDAVARFRTVPPQEHYLDYVVDFVARHSLKEVDGGWQWKFDRRIFEQFGRGVRGLAVPYLSQVDCRLALLRSEHGLVTPEIGAFMFEKLGRVSPVIEIPEAGHHAMLDQPLILLTAVRTLLADWDHSEPHRR